MSHFTWAPYQRASYCYGRPRPGAVALARYLKEKFPRSYLGNIYSCRGIYGGSGYSHHAEGRAIDQMHPASSPSIGYQMVELLGPHGYRLGIDHIICNLQPWASGRGAPRTFAAAYPSGKYYSGLHPHKDHAHIGLTRTAGDKLTYATIKYVVEGVIEGPIEGINMADYTTIAGYKFYDYRKWPSWAVPAIKKAIASGRIIGIRFDNDPTHRIFDANGPVTRAQLAVVGERAGWIK